MLLNYGILVNNPRQRLVNHEARKLPYRYLLGELCFYLSASNSSEFISAYSPFWKSITKEDGTVNSGYGHRIFGKSERVGLVDQWALVKNILKADKDSRQAIINIHVPEDRIEASRDLPCTLSLQFFIRPNKDGQDSLYMIVNMRSNDLIKGFTIDFFQFSMLQEILTLELREFYPDLKLGTYYHNAGSFHVYEPDFQLIKDVVHEHENNVPPSLTMPEMQVSDLASIPNLLSLETKFRKTLIDKTVTFDVESDDDYKQLSTYWKTLVDICFLKRHNLLEQWKDSK